MKNKNTIFNNYKNHPITNIKKRNISILSTMIPSQYNFKKIQLICSTCAYNYDIDYKEISENRIKYLNNDYKKIIVIKIISDINKAVEPKFENYNNISIVTIGLLDFILGMNDKNTLIDSYLLNNNKVFNSNIHLSKLPLFIFDSFQWNNVVLGFRLFNIIISGGTNKYRHKLSLLHYFLIKHLEVICEKESKIMIKSIYDNMKDPSVSLPFIDRDLYNLYKNRSTVDKSISMFQYKFLTNEIKAMKTYKLNKKTDEMNEIDIFNRQLTVDLSIIKIMIDRLLSFKDIDEFNTIYNNCLNEIKELENEHKIEVNLNPKIKELLLKKSFTNTSIDYFKKIKET